jgi:hypothetical protein
MARLLDKRRGRARLGLRGLDKVFMGKLTRLDSIQYV